MKEPTNVQIIEQSGIPVSAVIPYDEYLQAFPSVEADDDTLIPHEVVSILVDQDCNLVEAWRLHLGLTQKDVASRAGIRQAALSQMEKSDNLRTITLEKLANAVKLKVEQLTD